MSAVAGNHNRVTEEPEGPSRANTQACTLTQTHTRVPPHTYRLFKKATYLMILFCHAFMMPLLFDVWFLLYNTKANIMLRLSFTQRKSHSSVLGLSLWHAHMCFARTNEAKSWSYVCRKQWLAWGPMCQSAFIHCGVHFPGVGMQDIYSIWPYLSAFWFY